MVPTPESEEMKKFFISVLPAPSCMDHVESMEWDWGCRLLTERDGCLCVAKAMVPGLFPSHQEGAAGETWPGPLEELSL